jgi:uncharacterized protein (DUF433 family)
MNKNNLLELIIVDPEVMAGKPIIKGTRLTVQYIIGLLAQGSTMEEIIQEYEGISYDDILACLCFASEMLENTTFSPLILEKVS